MFSPHNTYKQILTKKVPKHVMRDSVGNPISVRRPHDFVQYLKDKQQNLQSVKFHNRIQQFINTKFYYENVCRRSLVAKRNIIKSMKAKEIDPKKKVLQFKVDGFRKKLILLRQHKIKKETYLRMFVTQKLSNVFPLSL